MAELAVAAVTVALTIFDKVLALTERYNKGSDTTLTDVHHQAKRWLLDMQASLRDSENQIDGGSDMLQQCVKHVDDTAYDIEDALSNFLLHIPDRRGLFQRMHDFAPFLPGNEVKKASSKLSSSMNRIMKNNKSYEKLEELLRQSSSSPRKEDWPKQILAEGDEIVGFETRNEELLTQLRRTDSSRLTILITGPGGSGKSTLVQSVYQSESTRNKGFGFHAWVHVPDMELEDLLLKISNEFTAPRQEGKGKKHEENYMKRKKFLLVLDNVWRTTDLDTIVKALPKGLPGSKIIITTRLSDVMLVPPDYIHDLSSGLSSDKAKELFCRKAFKNYRRDWPSIIEKWATTILDMCEGMPLPISAIGTSLAKKQPPVPFDWKRVHDNLGSKICDDSSGLSVIFRNLQPSYRDLRSNLKTCFLYFSMFPRGYSISQERLIRLWVAEGFVTSEGVQTAEEKAAEILDELTKRNMVVVRPLEVDGRQVRRYRVLHLVREINISRRRSFLTVLEQNYNPSGDSIRRLSVNNGPIKSIKGRTTRTRTLLVFGLASSSPSKDLEMILKTSKFLRVLDLQGVAALEKFPDHVVGLTLLKYLSMKGTQIKIVPKSIKKLVDLETLDLRQTNVTGLPNEICELEKLRHLLVFCKDVGGVDLSRGNVGALSFMQKLSHIKVKNNKGILEALGKLTGLRKLGLTDLEKEDGVVLCRSLETMGLLSKLDVRATSKGPLDLDHIVSDPFVALEYLRHLHMEGRLERVPHWISQLTSLKKIGLKWSKLRAATVNPLETLQGLPYLMELELVDFYTGEQLVFEADTFKELLILRMEQFDQLNSMRIEVRAMPQLKKLTMYGCKNLKVLPEGIAGLNTLDEFRYNDMPDEFIAELQSHGQSFERIRIIHS